MRLEEEHSGLEVDRSKNTVGDTVAGFVFNETFTPFVKTYHYKGGTHCCFNKTVNS